jgi:hypothetical protein
LFFRVKTVGWILSLSVIILVHYELLHMAYTDKIDFIEVMKISFFHKFLWTMNLPQNPLDFQLEIVNDNLLNFQIPLDLKNTTDSDTSFG